MISFPLSVHKTREAAEAGLALWLDIYPEEALSITFDGSLYHVTVTLPDDPR